MPVKRVRIQFKVFAPEAKEVLLAGSFNDWSGSSDPMKRDKTGAWKKVKMLPQGTHEYKYIVDGVWTLDPESPHTVPNQYGTRNSTIQVRRAGT